MIPESKITNKNIAPVIEHDFSLFIKNSPLDKITRVQKKLITDTIARLQLKQTKLAPRLIKIHADNFDLFVLNELTETSFLPGLYITSNKEISKQFILQSGVAIPLGKTFKNNEYIQAWDWSQSHLDNVVIKPIDGALGDHVHVNLHTKKDFTEAWNDTAQHSSSIIVEQMIKGFDHRLLVVGEIFIAATKKVPLTIIGDGVHTIRELIEIKNKKRKIAPGTALMKPIVMDLNIQKHLEALNLNQKSIIDKDQKHQLSNISNISKGGEHEDLTEKVHPEFRLIAEHLAKVLPMLNHVGIDLMAEDISQTPDNQSWAVIEINAIPSLKHHHFPISGQSRDVFSKVILQSLKVKSQAIKKLEKQAFKFSSASITNRDDHFFSFTPLVHKELIIRAAHKRNIALETIDQRLFSLCFDNNTHYFRDVIPDTTSIVARKLTLNKDLTQKILDSASINSANGRKFSIYNTEKACEYLKTLTLPVVVKAVLSFHSKEFFLNIFTKKQLLNAIKVLNKKFYIIEEQRHGNNYYLTLIHGQIIATAITTPANVIGNGKQSLSALIKEKNNNRKKNPYLASSLISIHPKIKEQLLQSGITEDSIIQNKKTIYLQEIASIDSGADSKDITTAVHLDFKQIVFNTWKAFPAMHYCTINIITEDISQAATEKNWAVIKVESSPDIALHHFPVFGKARDVAGKLVDSFFPKATIKAQQTALKKLYLVIKNANINTDYFHWIEKQMHLHALNGWVKTLENKSVVVFLSGMPNAINHLIELFNCDFPEAEFETKIHREFALDEFKILRDR